METIGTSGSKSSERPKDHRPYQDLNEGFGASFGASWYNGISTAVQQEGLCSEDQGFVNSGL